ncbi:GNAT family N-acetyltransferase [Streptomyces sp. NPDC047315]|uniref:GNAT family N-acetyltransferase n=1 Tax=Streptomyces sp. NPDC047315 TaxID=3155142 RepID=UPI0033C90FD5
MSSAPPRNLAHLTFRDAREEDVPALVALIQSAYRGEESRVGWSTEADLIGGIRIDADGVRTIIRAPDSRLVVVADAGETISCFQLERRGEWAYFGLFAVRPGLQGAGVGRRVIGEAEGMARARWGAREVRMTVIAQRVELIAWYERCGYRRTGRLSPFPYGDERVGTPLRDDLVFEELVKPLS